MGKPQANSAQAASLGSLKRIFYIGELLDSGAAEPLIKGSYPRPKSSTGYGESRAALARMKYLGACQTGPSKPRTSKGKLHRQDAFLRPAGCELPQRAN
jgi:hypothetical protein